MTSPNDEDCKNKQLTLGFDFDYKGKGYITHKTFYEHKAKQGTKEWESARKDVIITGTSASVAIDANSFTSQEDLIQSLNGVIVKKITPDQKVQMDNGHLFEPYLREYLSLYFKIKIIETGFIIPKFDTDIGTSLDGLTDEEIIEIKTTQEIPFGLSQHKQRKEMGFFFPERYHKHIYYSHYCQIQHNMACVNRKWCIYLVFAIKTGDMYIERISFNKEFWDLVLYPAERKFIENYKMSLFDTKIKKYS
jgi:hypothetical protein